MLITGVGSRKTPANVLEAFEKFARTASRGPYGAWFRSGHADGADYAFEKGAGDKCIVYLPWDSFNCQLPILGRGMALNIVDEDALRIVEEHEPYAARCSNGVKLLKCRNVFQVMGRDMCKMSDLLVCWTPNGDASGGTGLAIKLARSNNIPVIDVGSYNDVTEKLIWDLIEKDHPHIWKSLPHEVA